MQQALPGMPEDTKKDHRYRMQFRFWLDGNRDEEAGLADQLAELKNRRLFAPTLKGALQVFIDLKNGRIETLLQYFPWVEQYFKDKFDTRERTPSEEFEAIIRKIMDEQRPGPPTANALPAVTEAEVVQVDENESASDDFFDFMSEM